MASGHYLFLPGPFTLFFTPNAAGESKYNATIMKSFVCGGAGFRMSTDGVFSAIPQEDSNRQALLFMGQQHRLRSCFSECIRNCHPPHYLKNIPNGIRRFYSRPGFRTLLWVNKRTARVLVFYSKSPFYAWTKWTSCKDPIFLSSSCPIS